ncbi:MAG TPA: DUF190 domain-containing protein [Chitinophaga sp.]
MLQAQIYIDKDELRGMQPLYQFIMHFLLEQHAAGATAFRGQWGFGSQHRLKRPDRLFSFDEPPMLITFIDEDEKVMQIITELRKHYKGGLIVTNKVEQW